jgi:hypothetical protein
MYYSVYKCEYISYIQYMHTLQVRMSTTGIVIPYIGCGCRSPNSRKYIILNGNFVLDLRDVFQERYPGVK